MKKNSFLQPFIVKIDFDDTIMSKETGELLPNAKEVIQWMHNHGFYIIIWTCRDKEKLVEAITFLEENEIPFDKVNENADFITFTESNKVFGDVCIDDRNLGTFMNINWLNIKEEMRKIYIQQLGKEIMEIVDKMKKIKQAKNEDPEAPYLRGRPNKESPEQGMPESVQEQYEGLEGEEGQQRKRDDQQKIISPKRDWIDDESLLDKVISSRDLDMGDPEYYENPKGTGEKISPAVTGPDEEAVQQMIDEVLIHREKRKPSKQKYRRDETQKYPTTEQPLYREKYWKEKHPK